MRGVVSARSCTSMMLNDWSRYRARSEPSGFVNRAMESLKRLGAKMPVSSAKKQKSSRVMKMLRSWRSRSLSNSL